jgi:hypothetical protein
MAVIAKLTLISIRAIPPEPSEEVADSPQLEPSFATNGFDRTARARLVHLGINPIDIRRYFGINILKSGGTTPIAKGN